MNGANTTDDEILDAVDYRAEQLPHPVELLSADLLADVSGVPKTTVLSAASSLDDLRSDVLAGAILRLDTTPGPETWNAMRASLVGTRPSRGLASIMHARADEIANDPAFPLFLSGFDRLSSSGVANAVSHACSGLAREFVPFADTVLHASGETCAVTTPLARFSFLSSTLAMALQRLTSGGAGGLLSRQALRSVASSAGFGLLADTRDSQPHDEASDPFLPPVVEHDAPSGSLGQAVEAGVGLLLAGAVPLRTGTKLDDVLHASGLSSATFYRRFGSLAEFERKLVERTGRDVVRGFREDFFDGVLASIADGSMSPADAIAELQQRARAQMDRHIETKRPGTEVLPWMGTDIGRQLFAPAFAETSTERAQFFHDFAEALGLPMADGLDATAVASTLYSFSWIAEMLTRNAPDRKRCAEFMHERSALVQQFVFGVF